MLFKFIILISIVFFSLGYFLDITKAPKQSDVIFSLGGSDLSRIITASKLLHNGYSNQKKIIYFGSKTNVKLKAMFADLGNKITYVSNMKTTMDEMKYIENSITVHHYKSVLIVTSPPHSRRVDFLIQHFASKLNGKYIIVSSNPTWWHKNFYFLNIKAIEYSFLEIMKLTYNSMKYTFLKDTVLGKKLDVLSKKIKKYCYKSWNI